MMVSADFLAVLVGAALIVTASTPVILITLLIRDWLGRRLW